MMLGPLDAAWKSGVTLQNVKLKTEAFDYLQLPFDVKEGVVGRLQVQVPVHAMPAHWAQSFQRSNSSTSNLT